jgi:N-acetylmuramoyl-L-alanine amidase
MSMRTWRLALLALVALSAVGAVSEARVPAEFATLTVRDTSLTLDRRSGVAMVEAAPLARLLRGQLTVERAGIYALVVGKARTELVVGLPYARVLGGAPQSLVQAPHLRGTALWIPLQFVTELLPRLDTTFVFDRVKGELRVSSAPAIVAKATAPVARPVTPPPSAPKKSTRRVIIDPGHGGNDPGMRGYLPNGQIVWEKDIALGVAKRLATALKAQGVEVFLTRDRDTLIALHDRGPIANRLRGDLFLSIHVNAAGTAQRGASARGFETYFLAEAKTEDARRVQRMENEVVRFETEVATDDNDPLSFIVNDMAQNEHLRESLELAAAVQSGLATRHPGPNRGVKQAAFNVLVRAFMPAVLIETGFASNPAEAAWLNSATGQQSLADAIAVSTMQYLENYERRVGGSTR